MTLPEIKGCCWKCGGPMKLREVGSGLMDAAKAFLVGCSNDECEGATWWGSGHSSRRRWARRSDAIKYWNKYVERKKTA